MKILKPKRKIFLAKTAVEKERQILVAEEEREKPL